MAEAGGDWLDDIVAHYRVFSRQPDRLVEMPASDPAAIVEWLLTSTGVNFRIPDLADNDLTFQGARLLTAGGMPVGELLYTSGEGEVIAILFRKIQPDDDGFSDLIRDNIALMSWKGATATYVAVGPSSAASLNIFAGDFNTWRTERMNLLEAVTARLGLERVCFKPDCDRHAHTCQ